MEIAGIEEGDYSARLGVGDEKSSLFDQYERLSFEIHLNQEILRRSYSEPSRNVLERFVELAPPSPPRRVFHERNRSSKFSRVLKKLLKPIVRSKGKGMKIAQEERAKTQMRMDFKTVGRLADLLAVDL